MEKEIIRLPIRLTATEIKVARLDCFGYSNKEIAATLHMQPDTVSKHLSRIMDKLGVNNRVGPAEFMIENGLVTWPEIHEAYGIVWKLEK